MSLPNKQSIERYLNVSDSLAVLQSIINAGNNPNEIRKQLDLNRNTLGGIIIDNRNFGGTWARGAFSYNLTDVLDDNEARQLRDIAIRRSNFLQIKTAILRSEDQPAVQRVAMVGDVNNANDLGDALGNDFAVRIRAQNELLDTDRIALQTLAEQRNRFLQIKTAILRSEDQPAVQRVAMVGDVNNANDLGDALGNDFAVRIRAQNELLDTDRVALQTLAEQRNRFLQIKTAILRSEDQPAVQRVALVGNVNNANDLGDALGNDFAVRIRAQNELLDTDRVALQTLAEQRNRFLQIKTAILRSEDQPAVQRVATVGDVNNANDLGDALGNDFAVRIRAQNELLDTDRVALQTLAEQRNRFLQIKTAILRSEDQPAVQRVATVGDVNNANDLGDALGNDFAVRIRAQNELLDTDRVALQTLAEQRNRFLQIKTAILRSEDQPAVQRVATVGDVNNANDLGDALGNDFAVRIRAQNELLDTDRVALQTLAEQRNRFLQIKTAILRSEDQPAVQRVALVGNVNNANDLGDALGNDFAVRIRAQNELLDTDRVALQTLAEQRNRFLQIKTAILRSEDQPAVQRVATVGDVNNANDLGDALGNDFAVRIRAQNELLDTDRVALQTLAEQRNRFLQIKTAILRSEDQPAVQRVALVGNVNNANDLGDALGNDFAVRIRAQNELLDTDRVALQTLAEQRSKFFQIKAAIMASEDRALVRTVSTADDTQPAFAVALGNHFGVDIRTIDDLLPADRASLREVARQQSNYLVVKSKIDAITPSNSNSALLQLLKAIKDAPNNPADLRRVLSNKTSLGIHGVIGVDDLSDEHLRQLQTLTTQKYNALIIRDKISKITDPSVLEHFIHNIGPGTENDVRRELGNPAFGGLTLASSDALSDTDANSIKLLIQSKYDTVRGNKIAANAYVQNAPDPRLRHFSDQLVKKDAPRPNIPLSVAAPDAINLSAQNDLDTRYKGAKLHEGDQIYSIANFPKKVRTGVDVGAQGVLVQDHVGKVTDMTTAQEKAKLTPEEKVQMALKQAKMFLTNLKGTGEETIYLAGDDPEQAKRVCAAVLLLKGSLNVKIESQVPGFDVPKAKWNERQATVDKEFIKTHLPDSAIPKSSLEGIQKETHKFIETTKARREQMSSLRQKDVVGDEFTHSGAKKPSV